MFLSIEKWTVKIGGWIIGKLFDFTLWTLCGVFMLVSFLYLFIMFLVAKHVFTMFWAGIDKVVRVITV